MIDISNPDAILAVKYPFELVSKTDYSKEFRKILFAWHPDRCSHPKANDVTVHLNHLYEMADKMSSSIVNTNIVKFGKFEFEYLSKLPFTLGTMYCNTNRVLFEVPPSYKDLCEVYTRNINTIKPSLSDKKVYDYFLQFIPVVEHQVIYGSNIYILIKVCENFIPLRSVLDYFGGRIDNVHVAWIINRMLTTAAYCETRNIVNNSFTLDSFFIDPETHYGFDQAGWFFSTNINGTLTALPSENIDIYPKKALQDKRADSRFDVIAIKRISAILSGDPTGTGKKLPSDVPEALRKWILTPPRNSSTKEHMYWEGEIIEKAFGKKKFSEWGINSKLVLTTRG